MSQIYRRSVQWILTVLPKLHILALFTFTYNDFKFFYLMISIHLFITVQCCDVSIHFWQLEWIPSVTWTALSHSVCLSLVLNVNQPPADSAALSGFVFLNSAPKLLLILYAEVLERKKTLQRDKPHSQITTRKDWQRAILRKNVKCVPGELPEERLKGDPLGRLNAVSKFYANFVHNYCRFLTFLQYRCNICPEVVQEQRSEGYTNH